MKQMKVALVAVWAVLIGMTFTSCLDSDDSPVVNYDVVTLIDYLGSKVVVSDNGYQLDIQNIEAMASKDGTYPRRGVIQWEEVKGASYEPGQTSYKAVFTEYVSILHIADVDYTGAAESLAPILELGSVAGGGNYLNVTADVRVNGDDYDLEEDFVLQPDKVENGVLYCKFIHRVAVESEGATNGFVTFSFELPRKNELQSAFPDLVFTGNNGNIIDVIVTADGLFDQELKTQKVKVLIRD